MPNSVNSLEIARQVIDIEISALHDMSSRLGADFHAAVQLILSTKGRVVVVGMGKSGLIGKKITATFASTGTPSFFVHPAEAFHGDLGMIKPTDTVLMISNSGESEELVRLIPFLQYQENRIIAMTGRLNSTLAVNAHAVLDISVKQEACTNNLAPTSSTTATLVMGDALAVALSTLKDFKPEDFARFHPGGSLGRRLLTKVRDVMHKQNLPTCQPDTTFRDLIHSISAGRLGLVLVMDGNEELAGIITDGDVRRAFEMHEDPTTLSAQHIMTKQPKVIGQNESFAFAEEYMRTKKLSSLIVLDAHDNVVGVLQIYDIG
ncbi:KpsF/GutQ family sugar-phosphate isomerase [Chitinilyticum piscinae]|uniref:KpsF/GutQ family sugar-phosphate isomerase n=1 Tax=Chitinilyticum piscinae TaxID=2866724 RepID=A0A8J7FHH6_9NEIS|nr:KpsF/GutQ family sugar-phosphate isomerase [Chitinilyticum piscinae]MBE9607847.1 KpsF/GutQ family sugar-phosphate isomerase [Chitinilyticum piscinae]